MGLINGPKPKDIVKLNVTKKAAHRILASLSWNPNANQKIDPQYQIEQIIDSIKIVIKNPKTLKHFIKKPALLTQKDDEADREADDQNYDLDLCCYAYDKDKNFKSIVDPSAYNAIDASEMVYHNGDNMDGEGLYDEEIHIELKDAKNTYNHFFLVVESDCAHKINEIDTPCARLIDSYSRENLLEVNINKLPDSDNFTYIFCHIFLKNNEWYLENISEFIDLEKEGSWDKYLKRYIND